MVTKTAKTATAKKVSAAAKKEFVPQYVKESVPVGNSQNVSDMISASNKSRDAEIARLNEIISARDKEFVDNSNSRRNLYIENNSLHDTLSKLYLSNAVTLLVLVPLLIAYFH